MKLEAMKAALTSKAARQVLLTKKHSPKILLIAGTVGAVAATVLACRATLKSSTVLHNHEIGLKLIEKKDVYSPEERVALKRKANFKVAGEIAKLYAPAVGLGALSIAALAGSHIILSKRNGAVMAAYAALHQAHNQYRGRVSETYGEDVDRKFALGNQDIVVEEKTAEGTTKTHTVEGPKDGKFGGSPYAVMFDESSRFFSREPGMNANLIVMKQNHANDKLRVNGHLFLNEVYDLLGLPRTKEGSVVGWIYKPEDPRHEGDNYITFGLWEGEPEMVEGFVDGHVKYARLDFNVDGLIWDKI